MSKDHHTLYNAGPPRVRAHEEEPSLENIHRRLVRTETRLCDVIKTNVEKEELQSTARVRIRHMETELENIKAMLFDLTVAFKGFKREWDEEGQIDDDETS